MGSEMILWIFGSSILNGWSSRDNNKKQEPYLSLEVRVKIYYGPLTDDFGMCEG